MKRLFFFSAIILVFTQCSQPTTQEATETEENPAAEGFNLTDSDPEAIEIADQVMKSMGGRKAWDTTRYIQWNFFGFRKLLWDKHTGWVRVETPSADTKIIVNIKADSLMGKVYKQGVVFENPDSIQFYLERGKRIWINDAYWLVMPFKMKDSGVTLNHLGSDTIQTGESSQKLMLTFESVGVTPQNAYHVWVSDSSKLVNQWAYYREASDTVPGFIMPWQNYEKYGSILLSGDRGQRKLTDISVSQEVDTKMFESFDLSL